MVINHVNSKSYYTSGNIIICDYNSDTHRFIDSKSSYVSYKEALTTGY